MNNSKPDVIGERLSAIANSASLQDEPYGYLVYGVDDKTHEVIGTKFNVKSESNPQGLYEQSSLFLSLVSHVCFHDI